MPKQKPLAGRGSLLTKVGTQGFCPIGILAVRAQNTRYIALSAATGTIVSCESLTILNDKSHLITSLFGG